MPRPLVRSFTGLFQQEKISDGSKALDDKIARRRELPHSKRPRRRNTETFDSPSTTATSSPTLSRRDTELSSGSTALVQIRSRPESPSRLKKCNHRHSCSICRGLKEFLRQDSASDDATQYFGGTKSQHRVDNGFVDLKLSKAVYAEVECRQCLEMYVCRQCIKLANLLQIDMIDEDDLHTPLTITVRAPVKTLQGGSSWRNRLGHGLDHTLDGIQANIEWRMQPLRQLIMVPITRKQEHRATIRTRSKGGVDMKFLQSCLDHCEKEHVKCQNPWDNAFTDARVPILLMDLEDRCLVWSNTDADYATLSYVWGNTADTFECRKATINHLQRKGSLDEPSFFEAPQTIHDAMDFAKRMGLRYIWIDRYCILQDDHGQKAEQIMAMAVVYAKARFTIIAADGSAQDGLSGWAREADLDSSTDLSSENATVRTSNVWYHGREVSLVAGLDFKTTTLGKSWATRGWTFQEQIFSRRAIVFHGGLAFWKCQRFFWQEDFRDATKSEDRPLMGADKLVPLAWPDLRQLAYLLAKYTARNLSYPCDSLSAFSGVFSFLLDFFPGGFLFGLPEMWFDIALLWHQNQPLEDRVDLARKNNLPGATLPSWSWARWQGSLNFDTWDAAAECLPRFPHDSVPLKIMPIVKWQKTTVSNNVSRTITNNFAEYRNHTTRRDLPLPKGWSHRMKLNRRGTSSADHFHHSSIDDNTGFAYPIPLPSGMRHAGKITDSIWHPYISANVKRAHLQIGSRLPRYCLTDSCYWLQLLSRHNRSPIGVLCLNVSFSETEPEDLEIFSGYSISPRITRPLSWDQYPARLGIDVEIIAISRAVREWTEETQNDVPLHTWEIEQAETRETTGLPVLYYEYYNVLWIERVDGVEGGMARRKGLGRIQRQLWEKEMTDEVNIVLC